MEEKSIQEKIESSRSETTEIAPVDSSEHTDLEKSESKSNHGPPSPAEVTIHLDRRQLIVMCVAMALAIFLISIDETIIVTAIPRITDEFHSINDVGWYGSAYLLSMCCFQLHFGKLYKDYSTKWVFIISIALFELGSLLCGVAPSSSVLIVGRAVAGGGGCGIISGVLIIISKAVPLTDRPLYTAGVSSIRIVAGIGGPLLGGVFTDKLTWRWCFFINLPFGAIVAAVFFFLYHPPTVYREKATVLKQIQRLDPLGLVLFVAACVCLIFGLQFGGTSDPWDSPRVIALFTLFGVFILSFAANEIYLGDAATMPPRIAKNRTVISASFFVLCIDAPYYAIAYFLPIFFQAAQGTSALESGLRTIPQLVGALTFSVIAGLFVRKTGLFAPAVILSTIITSIACGLLSTLTPNSGPAEWIGYQLMVGIGIGLGMQQAAVIIQHTLRVEDIPLGIAVVTFFQASGPAIMVSVAQNVFIQRLSQRLGNTVTGLDPHDIISTGATNLRNLVSKEDQATVINAINYALVWVWYTCTILGANSVWGILGMDWKKLHQLRKRKNKS
ncbi:MFS general substrate transporter [Patellaria atrata CBS 101060]|uniref:MFS general substrate transporter n=1 Tax=Patellaria atrata CBS 101060 TaxID=1346257 RepID=A0A9P4SDR4_9PEZI|nr:MFS general substrate transporter [Patellaria atrata CBS 101060]